MKRILPLFLAAVLFPIVVSADPPCPCFPHETTWIVTHCDTWNCAASAMIVANGDPYVMTMPTSSDSYRWVVVRRVASGSVVVSPDEPFELETFTTASDGATRLGVIDPIRFPMMISTPDGRTLVVSLKEEVAAAAHRRSVKH